MIVAANIQPQFADLGATFHTLVDMAYVAIREILSAVDIFVVLSFTWVSQVDKFLGEACSVVCIYMNAPGCARMDHLGPLSNLKESVFNK